MNLKRYYNKREILENKVKPWLTNQSIELLQEEEPTFINLCLNLLKEESSARRLKQKLERVLEEETQNFVRSCWRFLVFEQIKIKYEHRINYSIS